MPGNRQCDIACKKLFLSLNYTDVANFALVCWWEYPLGNILFSFAAFATVCCCLGLHNAFMYAMQTLLTGYVCVDEGDHSTQYYRLLREAVQELQELVKEHADKA